MAEVIDALQVSALLEYPTLIEHLRSAFADASVIASPLRHHHPLPAASSSPSPSAAPCLLLMPAWSVTPSPSSSSRPYIGVKIVTVFPANQRLGLPSISASYLLSSSLTGLPLAFVDGKELTLWRTACVSALAARFLARPDTQVLLMVGAGSLAPHLIRAHVAAHPGISRILVWNRTHAHAEALATAMRGEMAPRSVSAFTDIEEAARAADLISCATLSERPLVQGYWLRPGTHLDLVGSFSPNMRECDGEAIRCSRVYIDTDAACLEAGELVEADFEVDIQGTLSQLASGEKQGRQHANDITVFKSVGCALVDLVTAQLIYETNISSRNAAEAIQNVSEALQNVPTC